MVEDYKIIIITAVHVGDLIVSGTKEACSPFTSPRLASNFPTKK